MYVYTRRAPPQQLGGFKLKKLLKPIAHIGAAVFTGGSSLALSAKMMADSKARKAAGAMGKQAGAIAMQEAGLTQDNFDGAAYLAANPDVAKHKTWGSNPWGHYVKYGQAEGRAFTPNRTGAAQQVMTARAQPLMASQSQVRAIDNVITQQPFQTFSPSASVPSGDVALMRAGGNAEAGVPVPDAGFFGMDKKTLMLAGGALGAVLLASTLAGRRRS